MPSRLGRVPERHSCACENQLAPSVAAGAQIEQVAAETGTPVPVGYVLRHCARCVSRIGPFRCRDGQLVWCTPRWVRTRPSASPAIGSRRQPCTGSYLTTATSGTTSSGWSRRYIE